MKKEQILYLLQNVIPSAKLPSQIDFEISDNCLLIKVSGRGVVANMQENCSAFEGWAVVIKSAIPEVKRVILDWDEPQYKLEKENAQKAHYNRFLMRTTNFKRGYSWFDVAERRKSDIDIMRELLESKTLVVNFPKNSNRQHVDKNKKPEARESLALSNSE